MLRNLQEILEPAGFGGQLLEFPAGFYQGFSQKEPFLLSASKGGTYRRRYAPDPESCFSSFLILLTKPFMNHTSGGVGQLVECPLSVCVCVCLFFSI